MKTSRAAVSTALATIAIIFLLTAGMVWLSYTVVLNARSQAKAAEQAEGVALKSKELVRVYLWMLPLNQSGRILNTTMVTLKNEWSGETTIKTIMVVWKERGMIATELNLRLAAGEEFTRKPSEVGLPQELDDYPIALTLIKYVQVHTSLGNDFISLWGRPDKSIIIVRGGGITTSTIRETSTQTTTTTTPGTTTTTITLTSTITGTGPTTRAKYFAMSFSCSQSGSILRITIYYQWDPGDPPEPYPPWEINFMYRLFRRGTGGYFDYPGPTYRNINGPTSGSWYLTVDLSMFEPVYSNGWVVNALGQWTATAGVSFGYGCPYEPPTTTTSTPPPPPPPPTTTTTTSTPPPPPPPPTTTTSSPPPTSTTTITETTYVTTYTTTTTVTSTSTTYTGSIVTRTTTVTSTVFTTTTVWYTETIPVPTYVTTTATCHSTISRRAPGGFDDAGCGVTINGQMIEEIDNKVYEFSYPYNSVVFLSIIALAYTPDKRWKKQLKTALLVILVTSYVFYQSGTVAVNAQSVATTTTTTTVTISGTSTVTTWVTTTATNSGTTRTTGTTVTTTFTWTEYSDTYTLSTYTVYTCGPTTRVTEACAVCLGPNQCELCPRGS
ncbi:MAG: hypothetical protein QXD61_10710 [Candidatus Caldarchaeum sp.]